MGIVVKRPVRVVVVVTEQFKARRGAEIRAALTKLDAVSKRIDFELGRNEQKSEAAGQIMERLGREKRRNEQARMALRSELERVSTLDIGSEYPRGTLEGTVEVDVGDDFSKLGVCEIVVKDDKIVEIRDGLCPEINEISS